MLFSVRGSYPKISEEFQMKRIKLTVAYDGTNYHGWQVQPNGETIDGG